MVDAVDQHFYGTQGREAWEALRAENERLREALQALVDDDCHAFDCSSRRIERTCDCGAGVLPGRARAAIATATGEEEGK